MSAFVEALVKEPKAYALSLPDLAGLPSDVILDPIKYEFERILLVCESLPSLPASVARLIERIATEIQGLLPGVINISAINYLAKLFGPPKFDLAFDAALDINYAVGVHDQQMKFKSTLAFSALHSLLDRLHEAAQLESVEMKKQRAVKTAQKLEREHLLAVKKSLQEKLDTGHLAAGNVEIARYRLGVIEGRITYLNKQLSVFADGQSFIGNVGVVFQKLIPQTAAAILNPLRQLAEGVAQPIDIESSRFAVQPI